MVIPLKHILYGSDELTYFDNRVEEYAVTIAKSNALP